MGMAWLEGMGQTRPFASVVAKATHSTCIPARDLENRHVHDADAYGAEAALFHINQTDYYYSTSS